MMRILKNGWIVIAHQHLLPFALAMMVLGCAPKLTESELKIQEAERALSDTRSWFVQAALSDLTAEGEQAVPTLIAVLKSKDGNARARAALGLERLGGRAHSATEALGEALNDKIPAVIESSLKALTNINTPRSQQLLQQDKVRSLSSALAKLKNSNADVRSSATRDLFESGPRAMHAIPELLELLNDESIPVRTNAELTLMHIGVRQSQIEAAKGRRRSAHTLPRSVLDSPDAPPTATPSRTAKVNNTSGYDLIQRERNLLESAEPVTFEQLRVKRRDYEGQYVLFNRVKIEDDPSLLFIPGVGDFLVVTLRDETGDRLSPRERDSRVLVAVPTNLSSVVRDRRLAYPDYFFFVRAKLRSAGEYTIATITDFRVTE